ncbi:hypothetical protein L7F22_058768 [Adiantum nelumboides]|nr:hypothetical protein [Adiantum nelumboides]
MAGAVKHLRQGRHDLKSNQNREAPAGATLVCQKCTFSNASSANKCACCGCDSRFLKLIVKEDKLVAVAADRKSLSKDCQVLCHACKKSFESKSSVLELAYCNHVFCRHCISTSVGNLLLAFMQTHAGPYCSLNKYDNAMRCPVEGCGQPIGREDLGLVLGPSMQMLVDEWIMTSLTSQVIAPLLRCCPNCNDGKRQLLTSPDFHRLSLDSLQKAFECNKLSPCKGNCLRKSELVKRLRRAAPVFRLCSCCFAMVCPACGSQMTAGMGHQCDPLQRQCLDIIRAIMKLCGAYIHATRADIEQNPTKKCCLNDNESSHWMHGNGLTFEQCKWFCCKGFKIEPPLYGGQQSLPSFKGSFVDNLAPTAMHDLTASVSRVLDDNQCSVSSVVGAILCSNELPYILLKWLVKNDSLMDIAAHSDLYRALLAFMRAVSASYDFLPLLCSREAKHETTETQSRWETPGSVLAEFSKLFKQVQFMLRRVEQLNSGQSTHRRTREQLEFDCRLSSLMEDIKATYEFLHKRIEAWDWKIVQHPWLMRTYEVSSSRGKGEHQMKQLLCVELKEFIHEQTKLSSSPSSAKSVTICSKQADVDLNCSNHGKQLSMGDVKTTEGESVSSVPSAALVEVYKEALRPLQFDEACLLPTHYFRLVARNSKSLMLDKRRARTISEEMTLFNTRLPLEWDSSIFLRMDEQRMDVLRALIIGPKDTPYENGVFLFDILLEATYPDKPPKVHFLTTGGGKVRFNPNLYKNGTVCLSILGTWNDGPGWKAGQSSIMQVLVSIQGLVLVADPYYNEPGYKRGPNRFAADRYILHQRLNTIEHSMLPALSCPDPLFLPVIHTHFRLKAAQILSQCTAWMQEEKRPSFAKQYSRFINELHQNLDKL